MILLINIKLRVFRARHFIYSSQVWKCKKSPLKLRLLKLIANFLGQLSRLKANVDTQHKIFLSKIIKEEINFKQFLKEIYIILNMANTLFNIGEFHPRKGLSHYLLMFPYVSNFYLHNFPNYSFILFASHLE